MNTQQKRGDNIQLTRKTPRLAKAEMEYRRGRPTRRGREPETSVAMLHVSRWRAGGGVWKNAKSDQPSFGRPWSRAVRSLNTRSPMPNSVVSIDSYFSSDDSDDEEYRLAQKEWEESLEQLSQILSVVLLPFLGRWLGRRWSYWGVFMILSPLCISVTLHAAP